MPLNVGIVGTGIFATDQHLPTIQSIDSLEPYAAYNRTKSKAVAFAEKASIDKQNVYDSVEELFQNPKVDFVDALLPVQTNVEIIKTAIKFNKPIVVEKPIAANMEQAREIVKIASETDLPIGILEQWAYFNGINEVKKVLPKIGEVVSFTYRATGAWNPNNKYLNTSWRQKPEHIGGFLSDGGVHQLALLTEILGPVATVSGLTKQVREQSGTDDILFSTLKLKSGAIGTFTYGSAFGATDKSTSLIIFGTNGSIVYDFSPTLKKPTITYQTGGNSLEASGKTVIEVDEVDSVQEEFKNFAAAVEAKDKTLYKVPPTKAFHHLAIVAAALESTKNGGSSVAVEEA
ncbi:CIC11C00000003734 [Sungouiella intermedia]|uniref:CIC11C00000003734 n=1 Tax=Sungouiella intermedia TaxID=45354 RepID=A0A1L0CWG1_9ASCO|nr:CIC11C00000003734 [[Candida] intermedia]